MREIKRVIEETLRDAETLTETTNNEAPDFLCWMAAKLR
jgi:hypothetical protein